MTTYRRSFTVPLNPADDPARRERWWAHFVYFLMFAGTLALGMWLGLSDVLRDFKSEPVEAPEFIINRSGP